MTASRLVKMPAGWQEIIPKPASQEAVASVINSTIGDDGRSEFQWFWVIDGFTDDGPTYSLILGVYPTGDKFSEWEIEHS